MQNLTNLSGNSIRYWCRIKKKTRKNTELKKEEVKIQNLTNLSGNSIRCLVRGCKRGFGHSLNCTEHWIAPDCWKLSWKRFEAGWGRKGMTNMLLSAFVIVCITVILSCQRLLKIFNNNKWQICFCVQQRQTVMSSWPDELAAVWKRQASLMKRLIQPYISNGLDTLPEQDQYKQTFSSMADACLDSIAITNLFNWSCAVPRGGKMVFQSGQLFWYGMLQISWGNAK